MVVNAKTSPLTCLSAKSTIEAKFTIKAKFDYSKLKIARSVSASKEYLKGLILINKNQYGFLHNSGLYDRNCRI